MTMIDLWEYDDITIDSLDIDVPDWIEQDITPYDLAAILQGGCASGAYMPAVTYYQALDTMSSHGDDVLDFIQDAIGELPMPSSDTSWGGMAVHFLSVAVELWASSVEDEVEDAIEELAEA